ncbi:hypothetical protein MNBD_NITROSPINAE04-1947 [hydrothermal vent metagenome]|uniref:Uncharacterized protein n=1 Tax=hydrothermal vent metagenome TaxID=652676 RepID=A0A3B1CEX0_9ZZZZ
MDVSARFQDALSGKAPLPGSCLSGLPPVPRLMNNAIAQRTESEPALSFTFHISLPSVCDDSEASQ